MIYSQPNLQLPGAYVLRKIKIYLLCQTSLLVRNSLNGYGAGLMREYVGKCN